MKKKTGPSADFQIAENNFTLVIFGASGSLAKLKLFPALYELEKEKRMPKDYAIVGYARTEMSDEAFRKFFEKSIRDADKNVDEAALKKILTHLHYYTGSYDQKSSYEDFLKALKKIEKEKKRVRLAYFSIPPSAFPEVLKNLAEVPWDTRKSPLRLIIEKPFGYDLASAKKLLPDLSTITRISNSRYILNARLLKKFSTAILDFK